MKPVKNGSKHENWVSCEACEESQGKILEKTNLFIFSGDFVPIEENKQADNRKGRLIREEAEDDASDDERVDMSAITGQKELEERREKFYSVQGHGKFLPSKLLNFAPDVKNIYIYL